MTKLGLLGTIIIVVVIVAMLAYSAWLAAILLALTTVIGIGYFVVPFLKEFKRRLYL